MSDITNVSLNFSKVAAADKPVEAGAYAVIVKEFKMEKPKAEGGYPYFSVRAEIIDGPHAGRALFCNLTTNPEETSNGSQKNFMLYRFLKIFGMVNDNGEANIDPNLILNQPMTWVVVVTDDERNNVSTFKKAG